MAYRKLDSSDITAISATVAALAAVEKGWRRTVNRMGEVRGRLGGPRGALLLAPALVLASSSPSEADTVRYSVTPVRTASLVELRVETAFTGEPDGDTRFVFPRDRFGVSEMHRWIQDLGTLRGSRLSLVEPGVYRVEHEPGAEVSVSYTVAYDPDSAGFVAFGPSVGRDHFHFFGSQWMARVGPGDGPRRIEVLFKDEGWQGVVASSFGLGPGPHGVAAGDYDLDYSVIAGGRYRSDRTRCHGRPVLTLVQGGFELPDTRIFPLVSRIVCAQREVFDDFDRPFFTVFLTERRDLEAGAPVLHGFTAFLEPEVEYGELRHLLAHEMVHTWFPRTARLVEVDRPDAAEARTRWFHEGFTEYLARRILVEEGFAPLSWWVERTNEDLERLSYHPYRTLSLDGLERAVREGRYTNYHHRLHYLRGALIALTWDTEIRQGSGGEASLVDAVRRVVEQARDSGGTIGVDRLAAVFRDFGVDAAADLRRHLEGGRPLQAPPAAFAPGYWLASRSVPSYAPGYDVEALVSTGTIVDLNPDSPAGRAGLREGMEVVDADNAVPWLGRWDPAEPTVLLVETSAGEQRFSFSARGEPVEIPAFVPVDSRD